MSDGCASCQGANAASVDAPAGRPAPRSAGPVAAALIADLVCAYRILANEGVLDSFGHVSVRHPRASDRYLMSRALAPGSVTADDIMEFDLDGNPVEARGRKVYMERFIHGETYRARPDVNAVVHSHSPTVIPFSVTQVPLRAIFHNGSFLGDGVPVFEIREAAGENNTMLVDTGLTGRASCASRDHIRLHRHSGGRAKRGYPQSSSKL
jgi:HCOMODA/2-hydroxy-3-carboxy-muconic semialdehyde decarboxylase